LTVTHRGIDEAVDFGNIVSTLTVTKKGAQYSLTKLNDVQLFIKKEKYNMLKTQSWFNYADDLNLGLFQAADEGKDIDGFEEKVKSIQSMESGDPKKESQAAAILDEIAALPIKSDYKYIEPSEISEIKSARPDWGKNIKLDVSSLSDEKLFDKVYGAWLGRCVGCLLGQPIECWYRDRIVSMAFSALKEVLRTTLRVHHGSTALMTSEKPHIVMSLMR
jgi:hypothetical protein